MPQHFAGSALSLCHTRWLSLGSGAPRMNAPLPSCCAGASSGRACWVPAKTALQVGQRTWIEFPPAVHVQGKVNKGSHSFSVPGGFLQLLKSSCVSPAFSMWSLLFVVQKLFCCLSGGIALNKGVHWMSSWEGQAQHPPMPPFWICLSVYIL